MSERVRDRERGSLVEHNSVRFGCYCCGGDNAIWGSRRDGVRLVCRVLTETKHLMFHIVDQDTTRARARAANLLISSKKINTVQLIISGLIRSFCSSMKLLKFDGDHIGGTKDG